MSRPFASSHAGHSQRSPGASGHGRQEHVEARWANSRMITVLRGWGNAVVDATSNAATAVAVVNEQIANMRRANARQNISHHLNAFTVSTARGAEVLYRGAAMRPLARATAATIARELGIPNRGARHRTNIGVLNNFPNNTILIEYAFMTNRADMDAWGARRGRAVDAAARTIAANTGGRTSAPATPTPPAPATRRSWRLSGATNIRSGAGTNHRVTRLVPAGTAVREVTANGATRSANGSTWRNVTATVNGRTYTGWMVTTWMVSANTPQFVTNDAANFRAAPNGTIMRPPSKLPRGTVVTQISATTRNAGGHTWRNVRVVVNARTFNGWIATSMLRPRP